MLWDPIAEYLRHSRRRLEHMPTRRSPFWMRPCQFEVQLDLDSCFAALRWPWKMMPPCWHKRELVPSQQSWPLAGAGGVARAYQDFAPRTRKPAAEIAKEADVPIGTAHGWVREARRRGHLPPVGTAGWQAQAAVRQDPRRRRAEEARP